MILSKRGSGKVFPKHSKSNTHLDRDEMLATKEPENIYSREDVQVHHSTSSLWVVVNEKGEDRRAPTLFIY